MVNIKSLKGILAGILIGINTLSPFNSNAADFKVYNYAPSSSIYDGLLTFSTLQGTTSYSSSPSPNSLEIWNLDGGFSNMVVNLDPTISKTYTNQLSYKGSIPNGTTNSLRFSGVTNFPANILFTYLNKEKNGVSKGDCREVIVKGNGSRGDVSLSSISNAVESQVYTTNILNIAPIETTVTNFARNADGTVKIEGKARPGTVLWPEWSTNLVNWTSMSNQAKYVDVSTNNFGGFDGFSYTNLTATNNPMFFRMGNDSYNSGTSNLFANSQALSVKTLESAVNVPNTATSISPKSNFKILRYYSK